MHAQWSCPDDAPPARDYPIVIAGSDEQFPDCPAYYLRSAGMELPAVHLIEGTIHPAQLVSEWAMEVESGARSIETLSPKGRDGVHLYLRQKRQAEDYDREQRRKERGH